MAKPEPAATARAPRGVAISCRNLTKSFALVDAGSAWKLAFTNTNKLEHFTALAGVNIDVPKGEFVGVLGRNGAGKSTLLRTVGGIYAPDRGHASVDGHLSGIYELGMAGNSFLTGRGYAERVLGMLGFNGAKKREMIEDVLDFSELGERFEDPVYTYSAGMGARLFFSVATAGRYEVYLIDEVLSVGDEQFQQKCWRRVRERLAGGASGILVTHDWSAVLKLCSHAVILDKGEIVYAGAPHIAVRRYLYGDEAAVPIVDGVARFVRPAPELIQVAAGETLRASFGVEILRDEEVSFAAALEKLEIGDGWETVLMTRELGVVGREAGKYTIEFTVPDMPLEPGRFVLTVNLVRRNPEPNRPHAFLDMLGWLSGTGIAVDVTGAPSPARLRPTGVWSVAR